MNIGDEGVGKMNRNDGENSIFSNGVHGELVSMRADEGESRGWSVERGKGIEL